MIFLLNWGDLFQVQNVRFRGCNPQKFATVSHWLSQSEDFTTFCGCDENPHNPLKHPTKTTNLEPCFQSTFNIRLWRPFHGGTQGGGTFFRAMINGCEFGYTGGMVRWRAHECCEFGAVWGLHAYSQTFGLSRPAKRSLMLVKQVAFRWKV